ncbi:MAG TPA: hypothetical protein VK530_11230 [Candidatus Acidoferrum sp.]|nr:hypothetical protein [Candidatus Acidoferrum sp.]
MVAGMFATWELIEVCGFASAPLGISFAGSDFEAMERSRTEPEARGEV